MNRLVARFGAALVMLGCLPLASAQTGTVQFSQANYTVTVSQGVAQIPILFSGSTDSNATIDFLTASGGTASAGQAYVAVSNTLDFAVGVLTNIATVSILNNGVAQSTQTVNLALINPTGPAQLGTPVTAVLTIINDELEQIQFAQPTYTVDDTDTTVVATLVCTGTTNPLVVVDFSTSDGSAKAGINYTATTGTVTFVNGVATNSIVIPLVTPSGPTTNQTFNLTLSNPTAGGILGSPIKAVVTIVATGPSVIQLSAASYRVHEHVGHGTITAIRFGNASTQATVDYATSDGTAIKGTDYFGTGGTLSFAPGASQSRFSFQFVKFPTFQSNKTVTVALANPSSGTALGSPSTAVLTIVNDEPQTITFTNATGSVVTLRLRFAGTMAVLESDPLDLLLESTDDASVLTISTKAGKTPAGSLQIHQITGTGGCRFIDAKNFDLVGAGDVGAGIQLGASLTKLRIHDLRASAAVTAAGTADQSTTILAHNLDDGCAITLGSRLSNLIAARLGNGATITAPGIGTLRISGDKRNRIPADCCGVINIAGTGLATDQLALGNLAVAGNISNATIEVTNGSVGSISAGQILDSTVYVGYTPTDPGNPVAGRGAFSANLRLGSVSVRARVAGFVNSALAAAIIGNIHLRSVVTDNQGRPFGVLANESITGVTVKSPAFRWSPTVAPDQSLGDFHVILPVVQ